MKRLKTLNVQNKIMYIYCLGMNGNVVYYGIVQGKVLHKMPSPDFDGSYGKNPEGIFWFDPSGGYHEWGNGSYYLSDRPKKINTPISITATTDLEHKGQIIPL